jgi:D-galactarolactone cycloisomerase
MERLNDRREAVSNSATAKGTADVSGVGSFQEHAIKSVETFVVRHELQADEQFEYAQYRYNDRTILLCRVTTESGFCGWGEAFGPALIHKTTIDTVYAPLLAGRNPFETDVIWESLYNKLRDHGQKGLAIEALSAVDIALWDLKGKITNLPLWALMGGKRRDRVVPYATGLYRRGGANEIGLLVDEAVSYVERGFRAVKLKIGFGRDYDLAAVKAVRNAIGDDIELKVDANHAYNASSAIDLGRRIEAYNIDWFEEPVPPEDIEGYREVKSALSIPVAGGEAEYTRFGFHRLFQARAVDIAQPDCTVTGGVSEFLNIVALATVHNIQCYPHVWGSAVALYTGLHCALTLPDFPPRLYPSEARLEFDQTANVFRDSLAGAPLRMKDGYVDAPDGPGLGIEIDTDLVESHRIA